jgi:hypothetical protein
MPPREITATSVVARQAGADGRGHRLLDDVDPARAGLVAGLLDRALLDPGDPAGDGDHDPRLGHMMPPVHLLDEVAQHPLGHVEVGYHAVLERPDGHDVARRPADHPFSLDADRHDLAVVRVQRHHGGLIEHDSAPTHVHERVGGAEVDRHVAAEEAHRVTHGGRQPSRSGASEPGGPGEAFVKKLPKTRRLGRAGQM